MVVALLLLFIVSAMIAIVILVDPNDYKDEITSVVSETSGRDFHINGEMKLSVFPWLGLEINDVSLDNPPDFSQTQFAAMQRLNIKVALLPLLKLQVKIGKVQLSGLEVNLEQRQDGSNNWDNLFPSGEEAQVSEAPKGSGSTEQSGGAVPLRELYIGGIDIDDATINWHDAKSDTSSSVEYFNLNTGAIRAGKNTAFKLRFAFRNEKPKIIAGIDLNGTAAYELESRRVVLNDFNLTVKASGTVVPGNDQEIKLAIDGLSADLAQETLDIKALEFEMAGVTAKLTLQAQKILSDTPSADGEFQMQIASIRELIVLMAQPVPLTSTDDVLGGLQLNTHFKAGNNDVSLNDLKLTFDESTLSGRLSIQNFTAPHYRYALTLDRINADQYLPPPLEDDTPVSSGAATSAGDALPIPVEMLRTLEADGEFNVGSLQIMDLTLTDIQTGLKATGGKVTLNPLSMKLYEGAFKGNATLDVTQAKPGYHVKLDLTAVQSGPLLQDYMGKRLLEGQMNASGNVQTNGAFISELKQNLAGKLNLVFRDGALSMDARQKLRDLKAGLKQKLTGEPQNSGSPLGEPTKFSSITATAVIAKGIVHNDDLEVRARQMYVTGKGRFELPTNYIDYVLTILLSDDGAGQDDPLNDLVDFPIEYRLQGKLEELDYAKITRQALTGAVRAKAKKELQGKKDAARAELERRKAEAAAKEQAEIERKKQEAEQRAREKLEDKKKKLLNRLLN